MPDDSVPPRKFYELKPREFETVNEPRPDAPPVTVPGPDPGIVPVGTGSIDVRELARQATVRDTPLTTNRPANHANEVHAMLRANHARAESAGLNELAPRPRRRSRRKRDYWTLMIAGNLAFAITAVTQRDNPLIAAFCLVAMFFLSGVITWIMWHVFDDYY